MTQTADLQARRDNIVNGSARLYATDFLGRRWLAEYVADVDTMCMAYERLKAQLAAQQAVIEAAQKFFGPKGERWFDRPECELLNWRIGATVACTCGGRELRRALAALDAHA